MIEIKQIRTILSSFFFRGKKEGLSYPKKHKKYNILGQRFPSIFFFLKEDLIPLIPSKL